jgi:hypothetical protein
MAAPAFATAAPGSAKPPGRPNAAGAPGKSVQSTLAGLKSNPGARLGAAVVAVGAVVLFALHGRKKTPATTVTGTDASKPDASAAVADPTIGEILSVLDRQGAATATLVDAANALTAAASAGPAAGSAAPAAPAAAAVDWSRSPGLVVTAAAASGARLAAAGGHLLNRTTSTAPASGGLASSGV